MQISIPERSTRTFQQALVALNKAGVPYVIGGAFAMYHYSEVWRYTNDLDLYLERKYVQAAIDALSAEDFRDYGEMAAGDREWIYHAIKNEVLVDLIWEPPNHLSPVDESFYSRGRLGAIFDVPVSFLPPEELVWAKIFTMNRHRCDWPDVFHIVRSCHQDIDWDYLLRRMGENWPVLLSLIVLYDWTYPSEMRAIPRRVRNELLKKKRQMPVISREPTRESILDPWIYTRPTSP